MKKYVVLYTTVMQPDVEQTATFTELEGAQVFWDHCLYLRGIFNLPESVRPI